jgi:hypothetical protein
MVDVDDVPPQSRSPDAELDRQTMLFIAGFSAVTAELRRQFEAEGAQFDVRAAASAIVRIQAMILGSIDHPLYRKDIRKAMERRLPIELAMFNSQKPGAKR